MSAMNPAARMNPDAAEPATVAYSLDNVGVTLPSSGGPRPILQGLTFDVAQGEVIGIVGRSGTGKTTLLRILGGLLKPTEGRITLGGKAMTGPPGTAVTVFQDYGNALLPWRTVSKNVGLGLEGRITRAERAERVDAVLRLVGLEGRETDYPWRLSGGMQQRVQIARALAVQPDVLLMDEPFGALDAMTKSALQDEVLRVKRKTGATVIFITHDLEEAIYLSDRVMVIAGAPGRIPLIEPTGLPEDRDQLGTKELPRYLELRHRLSSMLHDTEGR